VGNEISDRIALFLKKANQKLQTSKKLYDDEEYEDAISRAYYAMYHAARALLLTKNIEPKTHKGVLTSLGQFFIKTGTLERAYGKMLAYAKELRENGDYSEYYVAAEEDAKIVIDDAQKFIEEIKSILQKK
jgi:uncharacterized protein (UPF0332 family)